VFPLNYTIYGSATQGQTSKTWFHILALNAFARQIRSHNLSRLMRETTDNI